MLVFKWTRLHRQVFILFYFIIFCDHKMWLWWLIAWHSRRVLIMLLACLPEICCNFSVSLSLFKGVSTRLVLRRWCSLYFMLSSNWMMVRNTPFQPSDIYEVITNCVATLKATIMYIYIYFFNLHKNVCINCIPKLKKKVGIALRRTLYILVFHSDISI